MPEFVTTIVLQVAIKFSIYVCKNCIMACFYIKGVSINPV
jgi:hypothetical protein